MADVNALGKPLRISRAFYFYGALAAGKFITLPDEQSCGVILSCVGPNTTLSFIAADDEPLRQSVADFAALAGTLDVEPAQPKPLECAFHVDGAVEPAFRHAFYVHRAHEPAI